VIVITGYASVSSAVEAMRKGAYYYVPKPYKIDEVRVLVKYGGRRRKFLTLDENERDYIFWVLKQVDDNKTKTAKILSMDRVSFQRKIKRYRLQ
jgi:ActR/RegA family two-component response regulator